MNITVCSIFNGREYFFGSASLFEYPKQVIKLVTESKMEVSTAFRMAGLTDKEKIGYEEGVIGYLTKGRLPIVEYYKQAIRNALIHLENKELFI